MYPFSCNKYRSTSTPPQKTFEGSMTHYGTHRVSWSQALGLKHIRGDSINVTNFWCLFRHFFICLDLRLDSYLIKLVYKNLNRIPAMVSKDETTFLQASLKASKPTFFSGNFGKWGTILKLCSRSFRAPLSFSARLDFTRLFHRFKTEGWRGWCTRSNYQAQNHQPEAQNHQPEPKKTPKKYSSWPFGGQGERAEPR